ncbi:Uncharacterised protein [Mycobacterium tuberculosis]|uniref:Uncharacterized protein n=1 Tax=Mycobacterium tuberculosis TaxID=1773 RepID=A0A916L859_MYCTX|nr:Uncharacterised protein [Mycobacterium tuberculosis]COW65797.1 Uncharacterised protein [Mycobacterium tuberculosis]COX04462.1 Uncharacterised protein [Mycobacterium tuberculosis]
MFSSGPAVSASADSSSSIAASATKVTYDWYPSSSHSNGYAATMVRTVSTS